MIDAVSTYINGCADELSVIDFDAYEDTNVNWRVRRGYGALMTAYGAPSPLALNCQVKLIDHSGMLSLRIDTSLGTVTAGIAIITLPTNLIAEEAIRFHPALPAKLDAAARLPLGLADKVMLALVEPNDLPKDGSLRVPPCAPGLARFDPASVRPALHRRLFPGRFAQELEDAGEGALAAAGIDEIVSFLGNDYRRKLSL